MNILKLSISVAVLMILSSCSKLESLPSGGDYLVFGHFFGECGGEQCIETFKLTDRQLFEDINDNYRGTEFDWIELDEDKFLIVEDLFDEFPADLIDESDQTFGCPDCGDWGGNYVEYSANGKVGRWYLDMVQDDIPTYLHDFADLLNEKIQEINN